MNRESKQTDNAYLDMFHIERLAKDQTVSFYNIPCSGLVFVLKGTVHVSTGVYIKQTVGGGKCVRGTRTRQRIDTRYRRCRDAVLLLQFVDGFMQRPLPQGI